MCSPLSGTCAPRTCSTWHYALRWAWSKPKKLRSSRRCRGKLRQSSRSRRCFADVELDRVAVRERRARVGQAQRRRERAVQFQRAAHGARAAAVVWSFWLTIATKALTVRAMTEYVVTKQGATADWGSNAEGEVQEMPLSKPDGWGWPLPSVLPSQYNVMAVWQRERPDAPSASLPAAGRAQRLLKGKKRATQR